MKILYVFNYLLQPGADGKCIAIRVASVKSVKNDSFIGVFFLEIPLHHRQFIQVCQ